MMKGSDSLSTRVYRREFVMRCFLGFDLDSNSKLAVEHWREKALPPFKHPVPAANFHVTSVFLGNVKPHQLDEICTEIDACQFSPTEIHLNQLGYWSKPKILFLGTDQRNDGLASIATKLTSIAKNAGLQIHDRPYKPHVTLVRKVSDGSPGALFEPDFNCKFSELHLFESVSGTKGVQYPIRYSWPLFRIPGR